LTLALLCWSGCAASTAVAPKRVAVLEMRGIALKRQQVSRFREAMTRQVARVTSAEVVATKEVDRAAATIEVCRQPGQDAQDSCAVGTGARLGASHAVTGAVGGLGRTKVVQLRLFHVPRAALIRSLEETLFGDVPVVIAAAEPMAERLFEVRRRPWYTRWWVWTVAALVAAAAVTVPVVLTRQSDDPYEELTLPLGGLRRVPRR
jgi:hypothetical protein